MSSHTETYDIIGAAMEVHKVLGPGFTGYVYQDALQCELLRRGIPFEKEKLIKIQYKGIALDHYYKADFVCYDNVIVECKAVSDVDDSHIAQLINYLKATGLKLGLLINFAQDSLYYKRVVYNY